MDIDLNHKFDKFIYTISSKIVCDGISYEVGDFIGLGGNAVVHDCSSPRSDEELAIKFQVKTNGVREDRFKQEMEIHKQLNHPHLVRFVGCGSVEAKYNKNGRDTVKEIHYVIMEKCDCDLQTYIKEEKSSIPYAEYIGQFRGLVAALSTLHEIAIHRDIKPSNILLKGEIWKLSDFGLCTYIAPDVRQDLTPDEGKIGPANWMSPESNSKFAGYNEEIEPASDVFQLASIFWMIVNKRHPTGVLTEDDWTTPEKKLFSVLLKALQHSPIRRYPSGADFHKELVQAIEAPT